MLAAPMAIQWATGLVKGGGTVQQPAKKTAAKITLSDGKKPAAKESKKPSRIKLK
jgi:hypothetical protein